MCSEAAAQSQSIDTVLIRDADFKIVYAQGLEQPLYVEYDVKCPNSGASRSGLGFYGTKTLITSNHDDYALNVYDKGHCIPAASFDCNDWLLKKTFSYLNCVLQHEKLNRTTWKYLEEYERDLALKESVHVRIVIEFKAISRLPSNAAVPSGFFKELITKKRRECFYFPNSPPLSKNYQDFRCDCSTVPIWLKTVPTINFNRLE